MDIVSFRLEFGYISWVFDTVDVIVIGLNNHLGVPYPGIFNNVISFLVDKLHKLP